MGPPQSRYLLVYWCLASAYIISNAATYHINAAPESRTDDAARAPRCLISPDKLPVGAVDYHVDFGACSATEHNHTCDHLKCSRHLGYRGSISSSTCINGKWSRATGSCVAQPGACLSPPGLARPPGTEPWPLLDCLGALDNAACTTICSTGYVSLDPAGGPTVRCSEGQWHSSIEPGTGCKAEASTPFQRFIGYHALDSSNLQEITSCSQESCCAATCSNHSLCTGYMWAYDLHPLNTYHKWCWLKQGRFDVKQASNASPPAERWSWAAHGLVVAKRICMGPPTLPHSSFDMECKDVLVGVSCRGKCDVNYRSVTGSDVTAACTTGGWSVRGACTEGTGSTELMSSRKVLQAAPVGYCHYLSTTASYVPITRTEFVNFQHKVHSSDCCTNPTYCATRRCDAKVRPNCTCETGWRGLNCNTDVNECATNNGGCSQTCTNSPGSFSCSCPVRGWELGADMRSCVDINACDKAPCTVGVVAVDNCSDLAPPQEALGNAPGRVCTCPPGYFYTEAQGCQDIDECAAPPQEAAQAYLNARNISANLTANGGCEQNCTNAVGKPATSAANCTCQLAGYGINPTNLFACQGSSNACDETPCTAGAVAVDNCKNLAPPALGNAPGRVCTCPPGYFYTEAQGCQDIDECAVDNGGCWQICTNLPGNLTCSCHIGYTLTDDGKMCADNDECAIAKGGCSQKCVNTPGNFTCSCDIGYKLGDDDRTCEIDRCPEGCLSEAYEEGMCLVRIELKPGQTADYLNLAEVRLFNQSGLKIPKSRLKFSMSTFMSAYPPELCFDDVLDTMCSTADGDKNPYMDISYQCSEGLAKVEVYNRGMVPAGLNADILRRISAFQMRFYNAKKDEVGAMYWFAGYEASYNVLVAGMCSVLIEPSKPGTPNLNLAEVNLFNGKREMIPASEVMLQLSSAYDNYPPRLCMDGDMNSFCSTRDDDATPKMRISYHCSEGLSKVQVVNRGNSGTGLNDVILRRIAAFQMRFIGENNVDTAIPYLFVGGETSYNIDVGDCFVQIEPRDSTMKNIPQLNVAEIQLYNQDGDIIRTGQIKLSTEYREDWDTRKCIDGDLATFCSTSDGDKAPTMTIAYPCAARLSKVVVSNRRDSKAGINDEIQRRIISFQTRFWTKQSSSESFPFKELSLTYPVPAPVCKSLPTGAQWAACEGMSFGMECRGNCPSGYMGSLSTTCAQGGSWSAPRTSCSLATAFTVLQNVDYSSDNTLLVGKMTHEDCQALCVGKNTACVMYMFGTVRDCTECCWIVSDIDVDAKINPNAHVVVGFPITLGASMATWRHGVIVQVAKPAYVNLLKFKIACMPDSLTPCSQPEMWMSWPTVMDMVILKMELPLEGEYTLRVEGRDETGMMHYSRKIVVRLQATLYEDVDTTFIYTDYQMCIPVMMGKTPTTLCKDSFPGARYNAMLWARCRRALTRFFNNLHPTWTYQAWEYDVMQECNMDGVDGRPRGVSRMNVVGFADMFAMRAIGVINSRNVDTWLWNMPVDPPEGLTPYNWGGVGVQRRNEDDGYYALIGRVSRDVTLSIGEVVGHYRDMSGVQLENDAGYRIPIAPLWQRRYRILPGVEAWYRANVLVRADRGMTSRASPSILDPIRNAATLHDVDAMISALENVLLRRGMGALLGNNGATGEMADLMVEARYTWNLLSGGHLGVWVSWRNILQEAYDRRTQLFMGTPSVVPPSGMGGVTAAALMLGTIYGGSWI